MNLFPLVLGELPAESEDWMKHPAYIEENDTGALVYENR